MVSRDFNAARSIVKFEYDFLFICVIISAICLCFADDFLNFYLAIELQSLTFYILASFNRHSEFSTEAGLKYFVFGAIISCLLLFGICLLYLAFGSTSFELLFSLIISNDNGFFVAGMVFTVIALLFKLGAAPFHV
jgi:NADH-quinone oxidoreductase subunit N